MPVRHKKVSVLAPARLHMGFIDLSGSLGRHFGSIGVAIDEHATRLTLTAAAQCQVTGPSARRARQCLDNLCNALQVPNKLAVHVQSAIPAHVGLGSGTQMSLAIGSALNAYYDLQMSVRDIAAVMDRGLRSGVGIGVFEQGGVVVDGGRGEHTITPPLLARMEMPTDWRFILVFDRRGQGLHGQQELQAFDKLPPFPQTEAQRLCYLLLMQGLPAIAEHDIDNFGGFITALQHVVGNYFAPAQGGGAFTSPEVAQAMHWLAEQGAVAIGQTSWGPTGFCMVKDADSASALAAAAQQTFGHFDMLSFMVAGARNHGAAVQVDLLC